MESLLLDWDEKSLEITNLIKKLENDLADHPIPKSIRDGLIGFDERIKKYSQSTKSDDIEEIAKAAQMVAVSGMLVGQAIPKFKDASANIRTLGQDILRLSQDLRDTVENSPLNYQPLRKLDEEKGITNLHSIQSIRKNLNLIATDHEIHDQRVKKLLNENEIRIEKLSALSENLESNIQDEIKKISNLYESSLAEIEKKKSEIDKLLGHISGISIAGGFEKSAEDERNMANWLRYASLSCMALIVSVVGYSFWETTHNDFKLETSVFRMVLAFMLSIPAAYLAKESAKHREQQYAHQQTSLDLKAISPYIASLPEDEQHKIKGEIARRLFAAKSFDRTNADSYPINTHELMMEIIKKLELKR